MSDLDKIMVTGSTPIFVNRDSHEAVVAVVGLQMKYTQLFELLMNSSQLCTGNEIKCKLCNSEVSQSGQILPHYVFLLPKQKCLNVSVQNVSEKNARMNQGPE